jgi:putative ABC transport system permease protein
MSLVAAVRVALGALLVHKGRSALTSLGIVIGIAAVIAMVSAGEGVHSKLDERMATVGDNLVLIRSGARTKTGAVADSTPLTRDDAAAIRKQVGGLLTGVAEVQLTQRQATTRTTRTSLLCGTTPEMFAIRSWQLAGGRFFNAEDLAQAAPVCVIGQTVQRELFPDQTLPVGQTLRVDHMRLRVIGVLAAKGRNPMGADQDDEIFLPLTTLQRKVAGEEKISILLAAVKSEAQTGQAVDGIERVLRQTHRLKAGDSQDFDVSSVQEMAELAYTVTTTVQVLVAVIAGLSLVVGGIGIMNIMLVSVTERTREIGIRLAVGATGADVLTQFLIEAVILSVLGGLIGVTLGLGTAVALAAAAGWPVVVAPRVVLLAVAVSGAVGVFFGFYPAWKASRLDPIEALRYE